MSFLTASYQDEIKIVLNWPLNRVRVIHGVSYTRYCDFLAQERLLKSDNSAYNTGCKQIRVILYKEGKRQEKFTCLWEILGHGSWTIFSWGKWIQIQFYFCWKRFYLSVECMSILLIVHIRFELNIICFCCFFFC